MGKNIIKEIEKLKETLIKASLEYNKGIPIMSDNEYDEKMLLLKKLEKENKITSEDSPTQKVSYIDNLGVKVTHDSPMLSLEKITNSVEVIKWLNKNIKILLEADPLIDTSVVIQPKYDGIATNLKYLKGDMVVASTRGNGFVGEDITNNIPSQRIPTKIDYFNFPDKISIIGELIISKVNFWPYKENYSNPRNFVAGYTRNKEYVETPIDFIAYELFTGENNFETEEEKIKFLQLSGFKIPELMLRIERTEEVPNIIKNLENTKFLYETDGLVIKFNSKKAQNILGTRTKSPKWAFAYKYESEKYITKLLNVRFQVGRTGKITPVAIFEPVNIDGVEIKQATLNNMTYLENLNIELGDYIFIERSNGVIPKVLGLVEKGEKTKKIIIPTGCSCPGKSNNWNYNKDKTLHYCVSQDCGFKISGKINLMVSKEALNIVSLGPKTVEILLANKIIKNREEILLLNKEEIYKDKILKLKGFGIKKYNKIVESLKNSISESKFWNVLYCLGIPDLGKTVSKLLSEKYKNISELLKASAEELQKIEGIGMKIADNIVKGLNKEENINLLKLMIDLGYKMEEYEENKTETVVKYPKKDIIINGKKIKTVLVTGSVPDFNRDSINRLLIKSGLEPKEGVTKNLDLLIIGEKPGLSKVNKANALGINTIKWDEFNKIITKK